MTLHCLCFLSCCSLCCAIAHVYFSLISGLSSSSICPLVRCRCSGEGGLLAGCFFFFFSPCFFLTACSLGVFCCWLIKGNYDRIMQHRQLWWAQGPRVQLILNEHPGQSTTSCFSQLVYTSILFFYALKIPVHVPRETKHIATKSKIYRLS